jgi:hypothetical protein
MSKTDTEAQSETRPAAPVWRTRLIAVLAAAAAAAAVAVVAMAVGAEMEAAPPGQDAMPVGVVNAVFASLFAAGAGWLARAVLDRFAPRKAALVWLIGAAAVFLLTSFSPFLAEATPGTKAALFLMHVVVAAAVVPVLGRRRPDREA